MATSESFKKRINEIISDMDISKGEFAELTGVNKTLISHATLYGIIPNLKNLIKIANRLEISMDFLLGKTSENFFYKATTPSTFHERLIELTNKKQVKFSTIAHSMPFARNLFHGWVKRQGFPTVENLYILADYFHVSPDYLLGRSDEQN